MAKPAPSRLTHTIIEPGEFEKSVLRNVHRDITNLAPSVEQLGVNIQRFAGEVDQDFLTPLLTSPHPNVHFIGKTQRDIAANFAADLVNKTNLGLRAYLNELQGMTPVDRKRIVIEFMATRQDFGAALPQFESAPNHAKAEFHLDKTMMLFRSFVAAQLVTTMRGIDVNNALNNPNLSKMSQEYDQAVKTGRFSYPINISPPIIGIAYIHMAMEEIVARQKLMLYGLEGEKLAAAMTEIKQQQRANFSNPNLPDGVAQTLAAQRHFDQLTVGKTGPH